MLNAHDVADFFLSSAENEDGERISHLKLQKLLYYAQGYSLALLNRPLFPEAIEHWTHGPVVAIVYQRYKNYGNGLLPVSHIEVEKYEDEELYVLNRVRNEKGQYSAWKLRDMTHEEYPWLSTEPGEVILTQVISDYFHEVVPKTSFNFDIDSMKEAVDAPVHQIPDDTLTDFEKFDKWMHQAF